MKLELVGVSHHRRAVEVRERVAYDREAAAELARRLAGDDGEAVVLSTCNRTEVYAVAADAERPFRDCAASRRPSTGCTTRARRSTSSASRPGLDSMVPGEGEILGQVRERVRGRRAGAAARPRLPAGAPRGQEGAARRRRSRESPASVSSAAAALAQQVFGDLDRPADPRRRRGQDRRAGRAEPAASRGAEISVVANRTLDRAQELAAELGAEAVGIERLAEELARADVVVTSTSAPGYVLRPADIPPRRGRPLFLIDLAVPRDLDPAIHELEDCFLYDIDDLQAVVAETLAGRRQEAERAEELVAAEAERFRAWQASLDVVPAIPSLRARAEEIRAAELARRRQRLSRRRAARRSSRPLRRSSTSSSTCRSSA